MLRFCQLWQPHPSNSFFFFFFGDILLSFLFPYTSLLPTLVTSFSIPYGEGLLLHVNHPQSMLAFFFSTYILLYNSKPELFETVLNLVSSQHFQVLLNCEEASSEVAFMCRQLISEKPFVLGLAQELVRGGEKLFIGDFFSVLITVL